MGLSRNKVAVSEGAAGSPPFYGERVRDRKSPLRNLKEDNNDFDEKVSVGRLVLFNFQGVRLLEEKVSVINAEGPPVPIPNTEVKLCSGENTLRETAREDSSVLTLVREANSFPC